MIIKNVKKISLLFVLTIVTFFVQHIKPQGLLFVGSKKGQIYLYNLENGTCVKKIANAHTDEVTAFASSATLLVSGSKKGDIKVWQRPDFLCTKEIKLPGRYATALVFFPKHASIIICGHSDAKISFCDIETGKNLVTFFNTNVKNRLKSRSIASLACSGNQLFVAYTHDTRVEIWDITVNLDCKPEHKKVIYKVGKKISGDCLGIDYGCGVIFRASFHTSSPNNFVVWCGSERTMKMYYRDVCALSDAGGIYNETNNYHKNCIGLVKDSYTLGRNKLVFTWNSNKKEEVIVANDKGCCDVWFLDRENNDSAYARLDRKFVLKDSPIVTSLLVLSSNDDEQENDEDERKEYIVEFPPYQDGRLRLRNTTICVPAIFLCLDLKSKELVKAVRDKDQTDLISEWEDL